MARKLDLSLRRIARLRLFPERSQTFHAVHVAGTNGKGTICFAVSRMLAHAGVRWGRFTSPFLIHPSDALVLNGKPMPIGEWERRAEDIRDLYRINSNKMLTTHATMKVELEALRQDISDSGWKDDDGAKQARIDVLRAGIRRFPNLNRFEPLSEFEIQAAVALNEFNTNPDVDVGIVEVGMGGTTDATNIMPKKTVTVISHIGHDHTQYLGNTLVDIAYTKAGIFAHRAPVVIDGRNTKPVLDALVTEARRHGAPFYITTMRNILPKHVASNMVVFEGYCAKMRLQRYTIDNLLCAYLAVRLTLDRMRIMDWEAYMNHDTLVKVIDDIIANATPPGRLQMITLPESYGRSEPIIVDGAHNLLGASVLGEALREYRDADTPVTWVVALSESPDKTPAEFLRNLPVDPLDNFAAIEYRVPDDSIPPPVASQKLLDGVASNVGDVHDDAVYPKGHIMSEDLLRWAIQKAQGGPIVITGSMYMLRDLFRLIGPPDPAPEIKTPLIKRAIEI
jgi:folylpolyglutamate synthase/dihydrofolate synthase